MGSSEAAPAGSPASNAVGELLAQRQMIDWQHWLLFLCLLAALWLEGTHFLS